MNTQINELKSLEAGYMPSREAAQSIEHKRLFAFIGAFAVGKTTLMNKITNIDKRFSEVISFTTRPPRGNDDLYRFIENSPENIEKITAQARAGNLINFAVHPTTNYIYGTEVSDYMTDSCMLAVTANNFETSTSRLPFSSIHPISVVASPGIWHNRILARSLSADEYQARITEARQSLEWCLDSSKMLYIDNGSPDITTTARSLIEEVSGGDSTSKQSRKIAEKMLAFIVSGQSL